METSACLSVCLVHRVKCSNIASAHHCGLHHQGAMAHRNAVVQRHLVQVLTKVPVLIIMDCSTEVSRRRVGLRGLPGSTPSSAGPSANSWLGAVEVKFSQDCTLSSPKDAEVTRGFGWAVGMPAVYHSTSERRMFTKHCNACMHTALHLRPASHGDIYA